MTKYYALAPNSEQPIPMASSPIAAGPAAEVGEDFVQLDVNALITGSREGFIAFALTGDSADPEIRHGNIVFIDPYVEPTNGKFVAVTINGLNCVKKFENTKRGLYLVSVNKDYEPREVMPSDSFTVLGVVCGVLAVRR